MAHESGSPPGSKRKDAITLLLLLFLVATFAGAYYLVMQRDKEIHDMNEDIVKLTHENAALASNVSRLEQTIATMEGAGAAANTRRGKPLTYTYEPGAIEKSWRAFQTIRGRMEQPPLAPEALEARITTEDLNGARGPELAEIQCFEKLIGPEGSPYLRTIFESNAEEVKHSGDIGMAASFAPGLENLLAFYVTLGEPASLAFLEELLTNQIAQVARTKFDGNYFTFATEPIAAALATCVGNETATGSEAEAPASDAREAAEPPAEPVP